MGWTTSAQFWVEINTTEQSRKLVEAIAGIQASAVNTTCYWEGKFAAPLLGIWTT